MSTIVVSDVCLWPQHIAGDEALKARLLGLADGELVVLKIGGRSGTWRKMKQGANPMPTPGLRAACDATKDWWATIYPVRKGELMSINEVRE